MPETAEIEIVFDEDETHTVARASLTLRNARFAGTGRAKRNPSDPSLPMVGEELAASRALAQLSHDLLDAAAEVISEREGQPARLSY